MSRKFNNNFAVVVDNQVVSKNLVTGVTSVTPIRLLLKQKIDPKIIESLPRISRGSRRDDSVFLNQILTCWKGFGTKVVDKVYNCRSIYFSLKFKQKFHEWYWKSQEKKIQAKYSPENLAKLLEEAGDDIDEDKLDKLLKQW